MVVLRKHALCALLADFWITSKIIIHVDGLALMHPFSGGVIGAGP
jgi:hypothetical protein